MDDISRMSLGSWMSFVGLDVRKAPGRFAHFVWLCEFPFRVCGSSSKFSYLCKLPPSCELGKCCWLIIEGWRVGAHTHSWAPQVHPFQASFFVLFVFYLLGIWVGFRVLSSCFDFSHFLGSIVDTKGGGDINKRCLYEQYQLRLDVLSSSEVVGHNLGLQCLCSHLPMPNLVCNLLDLVSV